MENKNLIEGNKLPMEGNKQNQGILSFDKEYTTFIAYLLMFVIIFIFFAGSVIFTFVGKKQLEEYINDIIENDQTPDYLTQNMDKRNEESRDRDLPQTPYLSFLDKEDIDELTKKKDIFKTVGYVNIGCQGLFLIIGFILLMKNYKNENLVGLMKFLFEKKIFLIVIFVVFFACFGVQMDYREKINNVINVPKGDGCDIDSKDNETKNAIVALGFEVFAEDPNIRKEERDRYCQLVESYKRSTNPEINNENFTSSDEYLDYDKFSEIFNPEKIIDNLKEKHKKQKEKFLKESFSNSGDDYYSKITDTKKKSSCYTDYEKITKFPIGTKWNGNCEPILPYGYSIDEYGRVFGDFEIILKTPKLKKIFKEFKDNENLKSDVKVVKTTFGPDVKVKIKNFDKHTTLKYKDFKIDLSNGDKVKVDFEKGKEDFSIELISAKKPNSINTQKTKIDKQGYVSITELTNIPSNVKGGRDIQKLRVNPLILEILNHINNVKGPDGKIKTVKQFATDPCDIDSKDIKTVNKIVAKGYNVLARDPDIRKKERIKYCKDFHEELRKKLNNN